MRKDALLPLIGFLLWVALGALPVKAAVNDELAGTAAYRQLKRATNR